MRNSLLFRCWYIFIIAIGLSSGAVQAQQGMVDPTFDQSDPGFRKGDGPGNTVSCIARLPDDRVYIGGDFMGFAGIPRGSIARVLADGTLDLSFDPGNTGFGANGFDGFVSAIAVQPDGKVLAGGSFTNFLGISCPRLARLNADGSLDNTFVTGIGPNSQVHSIAVQVDGKVLIAGAFQSYNGTPSNFIIRLTSSGAVDSTFNIGSGPSQFVNRIIVQPDGRIIIAGQFTSFAGQPRNRIARLNADGSLDTTFDPGAGTDNAINAIALQSDGKMLACGNFSLYNGVSRNRLVRINADGSIDSSFDIGTGPDQVVDDVVIDADGKILIGGGFTHYNGTPVERIARLLSNGTSDSSFNPGIGPNGSAAAIAPVSDGKVLIGGNFQDVGGTRRDYLARLNMNGANDSSYRPSSGMDGGVRAILVQQDDRVVIGGSFTAYNNAPVARLIRLDVNGALDPSFNPGSGPSDLVSDILPLADGSLMISGFFNTYDGVARKSVARISPDGALDPSFDPGSGPNLVIFASALEAGGKIVLGGTFTSFNGVARNRLVRLNTDGSVDMSFDIGTGANQGITAIAVQGDGKVYIGGTFTSYNGTARNRIARLNADGSLDTSFDPGIGPNAQTFAIIPMPDGTVVVGGDFTTVNGNTRKYIVRFNADGTQDATFTPGTAPASTVFDIYPIPSGQFLVSGGFFYPNGTNRAISRINPNGTLDLTFDHGAGYRGQIAAIGRQSDGKVIVGGDFTQLGGVGKNRIARLIACEIGLACDDGDPCTINDLVNGSCVCIGTFQDTDGDLICDVLDGCPNDPLKQAPGACGCGVIENDADADGICDNIDTCIDVDGDGYGQAGSTGCTFNGIDCDDFNIDHNPGSLEVCDGLDNNCNGQIDEGGVCGCPPAGTACDDENPCTTNDVQNGACACAGTTAAEICDGIDNDCDGLIDEGIPQRFADNDGDGFGDPLQPVPCSAPGVANANDCDDTNAAIFPGAAELCDGIDNDCNSAVDEGIDLTSDSFNCGQCGIVCPGGSSCVNGVCVPLPPPSTPVILASAPLSPSNSTTPILSGSSDTGTTVSIYASSTCQGAPIAVSGPLSGTTFSQQVVAGVNTITVYSARATNGGGLQSGCSFSFAYTHDAIAPPAPTLIGTTPVSPAISTSPSINGLNGETGATIALYASTSCTGPVVGTTSNANSSFTVSTTVGTSSTTSFTARAIDAAGNSSTCSNTVSYTNVATVEVCDGIDNDGDGLIDEGGVCGCPPAGTPCDDGRSCTVDETEDGACNCVGGWMRPIGTMCTDGDPNTTNDMCDGTGNCVGTFVYDADGDGFSISQGDCDDTNAAIHPGAAELCDGIDNDCDGQFDEGFPITYADDDGDGFGDPNIILPCTAPGVTNNLDCDDTNAAIHPGAIEVCDGLDNDCDGQVDTGCGCEPADQIYMAQNQYVGAGYADLLQLAAVSCPFDPQVSVLQCLQVVEPAFFNSIPLQGACMQCYLDFWDCTGMTCLNACDMGDSNSPFCLECLRNSPCAEAFMGCSGLTDGDGDGVFTQNDCDDNDPTVGTGLPELCDGLDNNCDGTVDEGLTNGEPCTHPDPCVTSAVYQNCACVAAVTSPDTDGDGACDAVDDCDNDPTIIDAPLWYADGDGDGYGTGSGFAFCVQPLPGFVQLNGDCADNDPAIHPGVAEICNGVDDNCDGLVDEDLPITYADNDGDGFGDINIIMPCDTPGVSNSDDCNDNDPLIGAGVCGNCSPADQLWIAQNQALIEDIMGGAVFSCIGANLEGCLLNALLNNTPLAEPCATCIAQRYTCILSTCLQACIGGFGTANCQACVQANCQQAYLSCSGLVDADGDGVFAGADCDDNNASVFPGATEICDGADNDCDGQVDEDVLITYYIDADGDGAGDDATAFFGDCEQSLGTAMLGGDCDDTDPTIFPGATDACATPDGIDNDCDGQIDEDGLATWYVDNDGDLFGDVADLGVVSCTPIAGAVTESGDCDDTNATINPAAFDDPCDGIDNDCNGNVDDNQAPLWFADNDGDGFGCCNVVAACIQPTGYVALGGDCNDNDPTIFPGATELCDGIDQACDGSNETWYADTDEDGFGDAANSIFDCTQPAGYLADNTDCDDSNPNRYPGGPIPCPVCSPADIAIILSDPQFLNNIGAGCTGNCFGSPDLVQCYAICIEQNTGLAQPCAECIAERQACIFTECFACLLDPGSVACQNCMATSTCNVAYIACSGLTDNDGDGSSPPFDCNDSNASVYPGAVEVCDGLDNDCDGLVDELTFTYYTDTDGDGYGVDGTGVQGDCDQPANTATQSGDCNDADGSVYPGALELCDGLDNDCNGEVDDNAGTLYYTDADADGFGNNATAIYSCTVIPDAVTVGGDCDDSDATINPGAADPCDAIDQDCSGGPFPTVWYIDADDDGFGDEFNSVSDCSQPSGYVSNSSDCDDANGSIFPGSGCGLCGQGEQVWIATHELELLDAITECAGMCFGSSDPECIALCMQAQGIPASVVCLSCVNDYADCATTGPCSTFCLQGPDICFSCLVLSGCVSDLSTCLGQIDADGDGAWAGSDCDDLNFNVNPFSPEVCDGVDNDCDGLVDEGLGLGESCGCGGVVVCDGNGGVTCNVSVTEICDGIDNNCDGQIDEGGVCGCLLGSPCDDGNACTSNDVMGPDCQCIGGPPTVCDDGNSCTIDMCDPILGCVFFMAPAGTACDDQIPLTINDQCNGAGSCVGMIAPPLDLCDGIDNDGDGLIDEDFVQEPCGCGGITVCVNGQVECAGGGGSEEICDGIDNDCDGMIDEGFGLGEVCGCGGVVICDGNGGVTCSVSLIEICDGIDNNCDGQVDENCSLSAAVRVFLEGPYNVGTGLMGDGMRALGLVPTTEPYAGTGYVHVGGGGETTTAQVLATPGNDAIVDWVVIELRSSTSNTTILGSRSALLQRDGDVVDMDGTSNLDFSLPTGSYYVAVIHRNHLAAMTRDPVTLGPGALIDFTTPALITYGTEARKSVPGSFPAQVLWSGDVNADSKLRYAGANNDRDPILFTIGGSVPTNTVIGYRTEDVNLDGQVRYAGTGNDRDPILFNIGGSVPTNERVEQLPH